MNEKIQRLKSLVESTPDRKEIHFLLAEAYFAEGMFEEAQISYEKAYEIDNSYLKAFIRLGELLIKKGSTDETKEIFYRVLKNNLEDREWLYAYAKLFREYELLDEALETYRKSLLYDKTNYEVYTEIADIYIIQKELSKAQQHYRNALSLCPNELILYVKLAYALYIDKKYDKSIETLKAGLRKKENSVELHFLLAKIYVELDKKQELKEEIDILQQLAPEKAEEIINNMV